MTSISLVLEKGFESCLAYFLLNYAIMNLNINKKSKIEVFAYH